ncbi:fungal specific transcription factor domain-containing protein [Colletotrichum graminicola]|uniref:Fungal specific transcription factor domain-containing protein n=1 Tax=Colletotrichum graminicola (strain M1.001 / M2 / FGSC 10212) TaxID=645133 RepID=E3QL05_COLGM|nr:fungal specific transcription factor domain-containing protein [Colletotrichum graminicola M1.001]EFQ31543.1 fungal specific transcription factor domain-containing protein [Colletotrichum graminicola M1.001]WDK10228.1 fungal specific transcription factor domain-containing protein [Colletotrichum graminicola]
MGPTTAVSSPTPSWVSYEETRKQLTSRPRGRIVYNEGRATFMENPFRGDIIDHLQSVTLNADGNDTEQSTNQSTSTSVSDHAETVQVESMDFDTFTLGPVEMLRLWQVFLERVNPMTKVVHVPSLEPLVFEAVTGGINLSTDFKALICCINVVAIMALSEAEAIQMLGAEKSSVLRRSTLTMKKALAETDFLRKYNMRILQCLVLYLVSVQGQLDRHAAWVLTGALVRIAQRMGLHRDGELLGLSPFETEIRRRIWWQIILLESKYAVLAGFCDAILPPNWNTKLPSNVNDADLVPGSLEPVKSREGATEMAFCLMTYESRLFFYNNLVPEFEAAIIGGGNVNTENYKRLATQSLGKYQEIVEKYEKELATAERKYTDASAGGIHLMASKVRSLVVQRLRDMILHAREPWNEEFDGEGGHRSFFRAWVISFENHINWYDAADDKFAWYHKLHFETDAFSAMIELLQWQPVGTLVERAWTVIDRLYHCHQDMYDMSKKDNLQRAENLLAGWSRRELAFRRLGFSCSTPFVVAKLRTFEVFRQQQSSLPFEEWPVPTSDKTIST